MNSAGIPVGKTPAAADYTFEKSVTAVDESSCITPTAYSHKKLTMLLGRATIPAEKIPTAIRLLENGTVRSFSRILPEFNPHATVSDPAARSLLEAGSTEDEKSLMKAIAHLLWLVQKEGPQTICQPTTSKADPSPLTLRKLLPPQKNKGKDV